MFQGIVIPSSPSFSTSDCSYLLGRSYIYTGKHLGFCSRGGKIAVFAYQGGQALHAVQYNIYIVKFQGGANIQQGGANTPPRPPLNEPLILHV